MKKKNKYKEYIDAGKANPNDQSIASLTADNTELRNQIKEERFCYIFIIVILFNSIVFQNLDSWGATLSISIMEIILLLVFARICGVQDLIGLVNKILAPLGNKLQQIAQSKNKSEDK